MKIAVAGGTGLIGRMVVDEVRRAGHEPVVLARSAGVDLMTGDGLDAALAVGVSRIIDVTNVATTKRSVAEQFFSQTTTSLVDAGHRHDIDHHVALSIAGIDGIGFGYYDGKLAQERTLDASDVPSTILRSTQFHEFAAQLLDRSGPVVMVPSMLSQPIAAREVAVALAGIVLGNPLGRAEDLAGPEPLKMIDMVRTLAHARGDRRPAISVRIPGAAGRAMARGALIPSTSGPRGRLTFDQWLRDTAPGSKATP